MLPSNPIHYPSVCSGIEAFSVAMRGLPFSPVAFSEIKPFPCAVLAHHYPDMPNLGDMTKIDGEQYYVEQLTLLSAAPPARISALPEIAPE